MIRLIIIFNIFILTIPVCAQWTVIDTLYAPSQCTIPIPYDVTTEFVSEDTAFYFYNTLSCSPSSPTYYVLYGTFDNYSTWNNLLSAWGFGDNSIKRMQYLNSTVGYVLTAFQTSRSLRKTTNSGINWTTIASGGGNENFYDFYFSDPDTGVIITVNGLLFRIVSDSIYSNDTISTGALLPKLYFRKNGYGYLMTYSPLSGGYTELYRTDDYGINWVFSLSDAGGLYSIEFCTDSIGFILSPNGVYKTIDRGVSWSFLNTPFGYYRSISSANCTDVFVVAANNNGWRLFKSGDGGSSWNEQTLPPGVIPYKVKMLDNQLGFLNAKGPVGLSPNLVLKTTTGGTNINEIKGYNELVIFPNPGSGKFEIELPQKIEDLKKLSLVIYNSSGNKIKYKTVSINQHKLLLDISAHPQGIYTIVLINNIEKYYGKIIIE